MKAEEKIKKLCEERLEKVNDLIDETHDEGDIGYHHGMKKVYKEILNLLEPKESCETCKYYDAPTHTYPCTECGRSPEKKIYWKPKEDVFENEDDIQAEVCSGLSEVCKMLSKETNDSKQKKKFLKHAEVFNNFSKLFKGVKSNE